MKLQSELPLVTRVKLCYISFTKFVCTRRDGTVNRRLFNLFDIKASAPATKFIKNIRVSTWDIQVDTSRGLWFRLFVPSATAVTKSLPFIVYFHGGGFQNYGPDSKLFDHFCTQLAAKLPAVIASVNYPLTPDHRYPSPYEDGYDALKFIDAQNTAVLPASTDLSRCFIGGDSAGGNIAHHVTVKALKNTEQFNKIRIAGVVALQPFFGGEEQTESELRLTGAPVLNVKLTDIMWRDFLPEGADRDHPAANVFGGGSNSEAAKEMKNLDFPRTLVIVGGNDPLQDWDARYVEWLKNCGKEVEQTMYPNAFHPFYLFPELPEFDLLMERLSNFIYLDQA